MTTVECLAVFRELCPEVRFSEVSLQEAARVAEVRRIHPYLPILVILPERDFDLALTAIRTGADDLLIVPFLETGLRGAVDRALAFSRTRTAQSATQQSGRRSLNYQVLQGYAETLLSKHRGLDIRTGERLLAVWGDVDKLALLLGNLLDNAVKFNESGGRLIVRAEPPVLDDASLIYLGGGNAEETIPREPADEVFKANAQPGSLDSGKPSGVSIGLATCQAILRQQLGRIFWEDRVEAGAWFSLLLPTRSAYEENLDVRHHN